MVVAVSTCIMALLWSDNFLYFLFS